MKNLRLFKLLFILFCINSYGQNLQNANWFFGSANWMNFGAAPSNVAIPPISSGPGLSYNEGCASVSDQNGNLLFVTDGVSVYQNMGTSLYLVTDALLGHNSSAQNVIIVPKPKKNYS